MSRTSTPSFICELPLVLIGDDERRLQIALDTQFRLREYDLHAYATQFGRSWFSQHLDANTIQTVASRAWNAVRQYQLGTRGRPRFKGKGQFHNVEGKSNRQGIRWRGGAVVWGDLTLRARI